MRLTVAAVAACLLSAHLTQPALAQEPCATLAMTVEMAALDGGVIAHDLRGADALEWLAIWNAIEPVSTTTGDQVVQFESETLPVFLIVVFTEGCVSAWWEQDRRLVDQINASVLGVSA